MLCRNFLIHFLKPLEPPAFFVAQNHVIMYAVLSHWLQATYLVLGDIDEFLSTSEVMTIPQVWHSSLSILSMLLVTETTLACIVIALRENSRHKQIYTRQKVKQAGSCSHQER